MWHSRGSQFLGFLILLIKEQDSFCVVHKSYSSVCAVVRAGLAQW